MCRSKAEGGRRCPDASEYSKSRTALRRAIQYREARGESTESLRQAANSLDQAAQKYGDIVTHHRIPLNSHIESLLTGLRSVGNPLIVGGTVRDSLLTKDSYKDIDIEVHEITSVDRLLSHLRSNGYRVDEVGREFGVLKTRLRNGEEIDLSLPRRDNRMGAGHRDFSIEVDTTMSLEEAASRRDFTINALYYDPQHEVIIDPFHGLRDIKERRLRHVGEAYAEDALRVLRGVQFASRFKLTMDDETVALSKSIRDEYDHLSAERVQGEWSKFLSKSQDARYGYSVLQDTGWDEKLGLGNVDLNQVAEQTNTVLRSVHAVKEDSVVYGTALVARQLNEDARSEFLSRVLDRAQSRKKARLLAASEPYSMGRSHQEVKRFSERLREDGLTVEQWSLLHHNVGSEASCERARKMSMLARKHDVYHQHMQAHVSGGMILEEARTNRGGPWVGEIMSRSREAQITGAIVDEASGREWVKKQLELRNSGTTL